VRNRGGRGRLTGGVRRHSCDRCLHTVGCACDRSTGDCKGGSHVLTCHPGDWLRREAPESPLQSVVPESSWTSVPIIMEQDQCSVTLGTLGEISFVSVAVGSSCTIEAFCCMFPSCGNETWSLWTPS
jgi:hypothetical protein